MKIVINPRYAVLTDFVEHLPEIFSNENEGEIIYEARNQIKRYKVDGYDLTVKSYKVPIRINRVAYTFFRPSKAKRAYEYASYLLQNGINSPEPVAYIETKRFGLFYRGYYISLFEQYPRMMREFSYDDYAGNEDILVAFARFTVTLHEKGILHLDYSPGNILFEKKGEEINFSILDLNRMRFGKLTRDNCLRNFDRISWNPAVISFIVGEYARARGWAEKECISKALSYHDEFRHKWEKKTELKNRIRKKTLHLTDK